MVVSSSAEEWDTQLKELLGHTDDVVWIYGAEWDDPLYVDEDYEHVWGCAGTDDDPMESVPAAVRDRDRPQLRDGMARLANGEVVTFSYEIDDADGRTVSITGRPITDEEDDVALLVGYRDEYVTPSQRDRTIRRAVDEAGVGIIVTDTEGVIEYVNRTFEGQTGYDRAELLGETPNVLHSGEHEEAFFADLWETITSGEVWEGEVVNERADGEQYVVREVISPLFDEEGALDGFVSAYRDVSERKAYERRLERQNEQLELLNRIICHDIRNDVQIIDAMGDVLGESVADGNRHYVDRLTEATEHAVELTDVVRDLVNILLSEEPIEPEPTALGDHLEEEVGALDRRYPSVDVVVEETVPSVSVRANEMLSAVFRNVLNNAVQHNHSDDPEVVVSATEEDGTVSVAIADNGPGIPDALREDLFDKGEKGLESSGTGLGLYLVATLIDLYDGDVWIEANEPTGTVVGIELDVVESGG